MTPSNPGEQIPDPITPVVGVAPATGADAEMFVSGELREARRNLQITRVASALLSVGMVAYLGIVTHQFQDALEPTHAAEIAHGIIAQRVEEQSPQIAEQVKQRIPQMIEQLPDYALQQIPQFRQRLSDQITGDLTGYATSTSQQLGTHLDDFLSAHKEEVAQMIEDSQNPEITERVGNDLEHEFMLYLKETPAGGGESYQTKLDQSLSQLQEVRAKMHRLADGKGLTDNELKTRRVIAFLSSNVDKGRESLVGK